MKDSTYKDLLDKYESGQSSISEEDYLHEHMSKTDPVLKPWSQFVKSHKTHASAEFNEQLWEKFDEKTRSTRKLWISVLSVAASVLLVLTLYLSYSDQPQKLSYEEKAKFLEETKAMLSDQKNSIFEQNILYEDDTIIIYINPN